MDWRQAAGRMRAELDRAALNERPRLVVAVLIKATLLRERVRVVLPDREALCALLGIGKQHMAGVWRELESCGIVRFRAVAGGWEAIVQPDSRLWTVEWVYDREALGRFLDWLERVPGQAQGELMPEPNLAEEMARVGVASSSQKGNCAAVTVPKLGTARQDATRPCTGTVNSSTGSPALQNSKADKTVELLRESDLVKRLAKFLADSPHVRDREDMAAWGAHWRLRVIRPDPERFAHALSLLEREAATGQWEAHKSRGSALKDLLKR